MQDLHSMSPMDVLGQHRYAGPTMGDMSCAIPDPRHHELWLLRLNVVATELSRTGDFREALRIADELPTGDLESVADALAAEPSASITEMSALATITANPTMPRAINLALALRTCPGYTTEQLAEFFAMSPSDMAQRMDFAITRAQRNYRPVPPPRGSAESTALRDETLNTYRLLFDEGYLGREALAPESPLCDVAVEIIRMCLSLVPDDDEMRGLLASMLFKQARRTARRGSDATLKAIWTQDRSRWDQRLIDEAHFHTLRCHSTPPGRYALEATVEDLVCTAPSADQVNWGLVMSKLDHICLRWPTQSVQVGRIIAIAHLHGRRSALSEADRLALDPNIAAMIEHEVAAIDE